MNEKDYNLTVSLISGPSQERFILCLKSLQAALEHFSSQIIVTNNNSPFDVANLAHKYFPETKIISNSQEVGFAEIQNKACAEIDTEYVLMLRDDVELFPNTVYKLKICLDRHAKAAVAAPAILVGSAHAKPQLPGMKLAGGLPIAWKLPTHYFLREAGGARYYESHVSFSDLRDQPLSYVKSRLFLAKTSALKEIGGFDEQYLNTVEDLDIGHRLRHCGYQLYQAEEAKCVSYKKLVTDRVPWGEMFCGWHRYNQKHHGGIVSVVSSFLVLILKGLLKIKGFKKEPLDLKDKEFNKILVYRLGTAKNYILLTPALKALRKKYPEAEITVLGNEVARSVLKNNPYVDKVKQVPSYFELKPNQIFSFSKLRTIRQFLKELTLDRWDLCVSFQDLFQWTDAIRSWLIGKYSGASYRLGLNTDGKGFFYTHKINDEALGLKHATRKYLDALKILGVVPDGLRTEISLTKDEEEYGKKWLYDNGVREGDFVLAVHASGHPESIERSSWSKDYFVQLLNQLSERHSMKILMTSGHDPRENNWVHYIRDEVTVSPICINSNLSLKHVASILKNTQLMIGNDSDNLHLAIAAGIPAIGIFGPTDYRLYGAYGDEVDLMAFYRSIDCRPCVNLYCSDPMCMKSITPEIILETASKAIKVIEKRRAAKQALSV